MKVRLRINKVLPSKSGMSQRGTSWSKNEYVGETLDQYPRTVFFSLFNPDMNKHYLPQVTDVVDVDFDIESRMVPDASMNERYFTEIKAYKIERVSGI